MQATLNKHTEEIDKQRIISAKLQERLKKATLHSASLDQIQSKLADLEDRSRRDNLRLMFLKEGEEKGNALALTLALTSQDGSRDSQLILRSECRLTAMALSVNLPWPREF